MAYVQYQLYNMVYVLYQLNYMAYVQYQLYNMAFVLYQLYHMAYVHLSRYVPSIMYSLPGYRAAAFFLVCEDLFDPLLDWW